MANDDPVELLKEMNTATRKFHAKHEQDKKKNEELKIIISDLKKKISEYNDYLKNIEEDYNLLLIRQYKLDERNVGSFGGPQKIYPNPYEAGAAGAAGADVVAVKRVYRAPTPPPLPSSAASAPTPPPLPSSAASAPIPPPLPSSAASAPIPPPLPSSAAPSPPLAKEKEMQEKMKAIIELIKK